MCNRAPGNNSIKQNDHVSFLGSRNHPGHALGEVSRNEDTLPNLHVGSYLFHSPRFIAWYSQTWRNFLSVLQWRKGHLAVSTKKAHIAICISEHIL